MVVVAIAAPSALLSLLSSLYNLTVTPLMPFSPLALIPLLSVSYHTLLPNVRMAQLGVVITTLFEGTDVQPAAFLTLNVYVPGARPVTVLEDPVPVMVTPPGFLINVQVPDGKPLNTTEPVGVVQVG